MRQITLVEYLGLVTMIQSDWERARERLCLDDRLTGLSEPDLAVEVRTIFVTESQNACYAAAQALGLMQRITTLPDLTAITPVAPQPFLALKTAQASYLRDDATRLARRVDFLFKQGFSEGAWFCSREAIDKTGAYIDVLVTTTRTLIASAATPHHQEA